MGALPAGVHTIVLLCVNNVLRGPLEALGRLGLLLSDGCETASTQLHLLTPKLRSSPSFLQMSSGACEGLGPLAVTGPEPVGHWKVEARTFQEVNKLRVRYYRRYWIVQKLKKTIEYYIRISMMKLIAAIGIICLAF